MIENFTKYRTQSNAAIVSTISYIIVIVSCSAYISEIERLNNYILRMFVVLCVFVQVLSLV